MLSDFFVVGNCEGRFAWHAYIVARRGSALQASVAQHRLSNKADVGERGFDKDRPNFADCLGPRPGFG
jgi:hypothetical protein